MYILWLFSLFICASFSILWRIMSSALTECNIYLVQFIIKLTWIYKGLWAKYNLFLVSTPRWEKIFRNPMRKREIYRFFCETNAPFRKATKPRCLSWSLDISIIPVTPPNVALRPANWYRSWYQYNTSNTPQCGASSRQLVPFFASAVDYSIYLPSRVEIFSWFYFYWLIL